MANLRALLMVLLTSWSGAAVGASLFKMEYGIEASLQFLTDACVAMLLSPILLALAFGVPYLRLPAIIMLITAGLCIRYKGSAYMYAIHGCIVAAVAFFTVHAFRTS